MEPGNTCLIYKITISGSIDADWRDWLQVSSISESVVYEGLPAAEMTCRVQDPSELRSLLNRLWDLNLSIYAMILVREQENLFAKEQNDEPL